MIEQILVFAGIWVLLVPICWAWVKGIDYMDKNHPDYKGNDLFGEDE